MIRLGWYIRHSPKPAWLRVLERGLGNTVEVVRPPWLPAPVGDADTRQRTAAFDERDIHAHVLAAQVDEIATTIGGQPLARLLAMGYRGMVPNLAYDAGADEATFEPLPRQRAKLAHYPPEPNAG